MPSKKTVHCFPVIAALFLGSGLARAYDFQFFPVDENTVWQYRVVHGNWADAASFQSDTTLEEISQVRVSGDQLTRRIKITGSGSEKTIMETCRVDSATIRCDYDGEAFNYRGYRMSNRVTR